MGLISFRSDASGRAARSAAAIVALTMVAVSPGLSPAAAAAGIFTGMGGSWRGDGSIKYYDGSSEGLRCTATNEVTDDGNKLKQLLKCAFPTGSAPLNIITDVTYRAAAGVVNGSWRETSYGWSGHISGSASSTKIEAQVSTTLQNVAVRVSVVTSGNQQTVIMRVRTPEGLTEISTQMRRT